MVNFISLSVESWIAPEEQKVVMQIVTSWMEEGLQQGLQQGRQEEALALILPQLPRRVGTVKLG